MEYSSKARCLYRMPYRELDFILDSLVDVSAMSRRLSAKSNLYVRSLNMAPQIMRYLMRANADSQIQWIGPRF
jgi:hypothetical protein